MTLENIFSAVIEGDTEEVQAQVSGLLESGSSAEEILQKGLIVAMEEVGKRYEEGDFFVPEMLIAARAMQAGLALLKPHLAADEVSSSGKVAIGTVKGDLHDIGKNLVAMILEGAGYEVVDLGTDVGPEMFMEAVRDGAQVIGMSALLTTTMNNMKDVIEAIEDMGMRDKVKIVIGGAPVTDDFAAKINADGFAPDASSAVRVVKQLLS
ncbi:MAG: corrinoid protein [Anaerolineales bacterium]|jgi:5-methyltetrahydrofolate--homocysteine methyltransferase